MNVFAVLFAPTAHIPYPAVVGISVAGSTPTPDSNTLCGLLEVLSVKVSVPVDLPSTTGEKVMLTLHVLPMASVAPPHAFAEIAKPLPWMATPLMINRAVPLFVNVTVLAALVWARG